MSVRRPLLLPLVPLYGAGVALAQRLRGTQDWLPEPVISVGSISAGGAGKTPMTLLLAELLRTRGLAPQILTRGYKRGSDEVERVNPDGFAARFGDEPLLLARRSGVPVYVGSDRYRAGLMAEGAAPAHSGVIHLLDDGFQHRGLGRDAEIVLLTQRDVDDVLLPAGDLREPLSALRRADVIVLREEEASLATALHRHVNEQRPPAVWIVRRSLSLPAALPKRPLVFCGIARPEGFVAMLPCKPVEIVAFADHHTYRERDIERLVARARQTGADGFVTTEKDAVKLNDAMGARLESVGPLAVPRLEVQLAGEDAAMDRLLALVMERHRRRLKL